MKRLRERDSQYVWHPFTQQQTAEAPIEIIRAEGVYLYSAEGKSYLDGNSSWWVNVHGHGHPHIAEALNEQFNTLDHVVFAGVTHPKAVELAERMTKLLPDTLRKVFFSDNGSTAVEVALKMAFQFFHNKGEAKRRVLAMNGSYHGDTFGAMSVGQRGYFNEPFEPFFFDADYMDFPAGNEKEILEKAESLLQKGEHAAVIVEPLVQGAAGMRMYGASFLNELIGIARKYGVLVIFDEVMTGFGRTGKMFACDHCHEKPDLICLSKGLTAGVLPLGLTVASDEIYDAFLSEDITKALLHGHSFTANALSCAVACASLDLFGQKETWQRIDEIGQWGEDFCDSLRELENVENVRRTGTIVALDVKVEGANNYFSNVRKEAYAHFLKDGILLRPLGNTIFVNPPFCITKEQYKQMTDSTLRFLNA